MRELAMRAIHPAPLLDQLEDRLLLPRQDPLHRTSDRGTVIERPVLPEPSAPTVHAHIGDLEHRAPAHVRPAGSGRLIDQGPTARACPGRSSAQGRGLEARARPSPDQRQLDRELLQRLRQVRVLLLAVSSSSCSGESTRPGFEDANAASAPSFASRRIRITTETSTPHFRAASACESSCELTSRNTSHFSSYLQERVI